MKILLIKKGAIGDLLMATPLIRQLKTKLKNCQLDVMVGKSAAVAIKGNKYIDQQIILEDKCFALSRSIKFSRELYKIRNDYDFIFILDKHWYFSLLVSKLTNSIVVGYARENIAKAFLDKYVEYNDVTRYHGYYYLDLLQKSGITTVDYEDIALDLMVTYTDECAASEFIALQYLENYVIVVNSGGNNAYEKNGLRMLSEDKALELINKLLLDEKIIILGGGQIDFEHNESYRKKLSYHPRLINAAGKLSLAESAYLFKHADHVYTTDCGAMHIAVACNLQNKLTAIFGPSNPRHILPPEYLDFAIWGDKDIYCTNYQLYGKIRRKEPDYFTDLDIYHLGK